MEVSVEAFAFLSKRSLTARAGTPAVTFTLNSWGDGVCLLLGSLEISQSWPIRSWSTSVAMLILTPIANIKVPRPVSWAPILQHIHQVFRSYTTLTLLKTIQMNKTSRFVYPWYSYSMQWTLSKLTLLLKARFWYVRKQLENLSKISITASSHAHTVLKSKSV